ncbi:Cytochrome c oxidase (cbb3-type) subunit CcoP [hydrothermal vent metagenome]|uniref:Cytochrome c oxidase subunit III n=1 Tax=hydrothermal vent metagenome TaxID=652676 RepID=A0A3B1ADI0_9ZZZZ
MSNAWSIYIIVFTLVNILGCLWLIRWTSKKRTDEANQGNVTGHTWDDTLQEYNNPLPRWWLWLFYLTILFSFVYMVLYPTVGNYAGVLGWTQTGQYQQEMDEADKNYGVIFKAYAAKPIADLAKNPQAMDSGHRLFLNNCATCHGSDAGGLTGYPNLTDKAWLYGGTPDAIKTSILGGRNGMMPPMGAGMNEQQLETITAYVLSLSGRETDSAKVAQGKTQFDSMCVACHDTNGKGIQALGAPDLTDNVWLYGGTPGLIKETIQKGRSGKMPTFRDLLGEEKAHLLAAYVYSLSQ